MEVPELGKAMEGGVQLLRVSPPEVNIKIAEDALEHIAGSPLDTVGTLLFAQAHAMLAHAKVALLDHDRTQVQGGEGR